MNNLSRFCQVGSYSCITKPGMEMTRVHLYTEDHRHPAIHTWKLRVHGREFVPVVLPCLPTHPSVEINILKWKGIVSSDLRFSPEIGFDIAETEINDQNGIYLCIFKDVSGRKVKKLVIDLLISKKIYMKTQLPRIYINKIVSESKKPKVSFGSLCIWVVIMHFYLDAFRR